MREEGSTLMDGITDEAMKRYTRRTFLRAGMAAGAVTVAPSLLAACGAEDAEGVGTPRASGSGSGGSTPTTPTSAAVASATGSADQATAAVGSTFAPEGSPETSGKTMAELRLAMAAIPPQLDPQTSSWIVMQRMYGLLYDTLIQRDWKANGDLVPGLAASWERVDDVTLELTLRDGVTWHDGTPFTAEDVKYTFDRTLSDDPNLGASGIFPIKEIVVLDDHLVRFTTDGPDGAFELRLSEANASIVPAGYHQEIGYEEFKMKPVGTGPYRLIEFVPDSHLSFEVNEDYFGGVAAAERVIVRSIPEVSTRVAALLNNEVDLILDLPPDQTATIEGAGGLTVNSVAPLNVNILNVNGLLAPTDKKEIRQALSLGINREVIVEQLLLGHGLWPSSIQSELDLLYIERPKLPYDPERAKQLLDEAGYGGEEIKYVLDTPNYYPLQREWSEAIVGMWSEIGLNVTMHGFDVAERVKLEGDDPYHLITNSSGVVADLIMPQTYGNPNGYFQSKMYPAGHWDGLNQVVETARATIDADERAAIYQDAIDTLNEEVMVIVMFTINRLAAMTQTIRWTGYPDWIVDLRPANFQVV